MKLEILQHLACYHFSLTLSCHSAQWPIQVTVMLGKEISFIWYVCPCVNIWKTKLNINKEYIQEWRLMRLLYCEKGKEKTKTIEPKKGKATKKLKRKYTRNTEKYNILFKETIIEISFKHQLLYNVNQRDWWVPRCMPSWQNQ